MLKYKPYSDTSLAVYGDKDKFFVSMKEIGAKYYLKLKPEPGWLINKNKEEDLKLLIYENSPNDPEVDPSSDPPSNPKVDPPVPEPSKLDEAVIAVKPKRKYTKKVKVTEVLTKTVENEIDKDDLEPPLCFKTAYRVV
jgi:hypothetical protein